MFLIVAFFVVHAISYRMGDLSRVFAELRPPAWATGVASGLIILYLFGARPAGELHLFSVLIREGELMQTTDFDQGNYVAGPHLHIEPFRAGRAPAPPDARPTRIGDRAVIRSHSVIYSDVEIGEEFKCGHAVVIRAETIMGRACVVGGRTTIEGRTVIGQGCRIMSHCYICTRTIIGDYVFIGPGCTFLNDRHPMRREGEVKGPTLESYVCVGGGVTLGPGITVGEGSFRGGGVCRPS